MAICTSRMYVNEFLEQIIKKITGHRSECVMTYNHTSDKLKEKASHTLCVQSQKTVKKDVKIEENKLKQKKVDEELSVEKMLVNINKTMIEMHCRKYQNARARLSLKRFRRANK